jgi:branched-chain amino acid transport system ATP-binding protein
MPDALLEVEMLNGYYGPSHVLQDVSFSMGDEPVAVIGRNGMGKSTLCAALTGLLGSARGSVRFEGRELMDTPAYKIAASGIGFVPQGRRLFPSLTVDEHLKLVAGRGNGKRWNPKRIYETFPRLAERKGNGAAQLSGGEQQMLAIARALLRNPRRLIMHEPSVVEQKLGVATALAERQLVMVAGQIAVETTAAELNADADAQRRYLGVEPLS